MQRQLDHLLSFITNRTVGLFILFASVFGVMLAIVVPPMVGIDEFYHFNRAYQISEGGFRSHIVGEKIGGNVPAEVSQYQWNVINLRYSKENKDINWGYWAKKAYDVPISDTNFVMEHYPGAATYNLASYVPAVIAIYIGDVLNLNFGYVALLARIAMLATYIMIVSLAIYIVRNQKIRWFIFAFALWPKILFQASVVTSDTLTIALTLLLFALLYKAFIIKTLTKTESILLMVASILLPLIKFNYIFISLLSLLVPANIIKSSLPLDKIKPILFKVLLLCAIILPTLLWVISVSGFADSNNRVQPVVQGVEPSVKGKIYYSLDNPIDTLELIPKTILKSVQVESSDYMASMAGYIGFNNVRIPSLSIFIAWMLAVLLIVYARADLLKNRLYIKWSFVMSTIGAVGVFAILYLTWTAAGKWIIDGVQGRYFLPFLPFILLLVAYLPFRILSSEKNIATLVAILTLFNLSVVLCVYIVTTYNLTSF